MGSFQALKDKHHEPTVLRQCPSGPTYCTDEMSASGFVGDRGVGRLTLVVRFTRICLQQLKSLSFSLLLAFSCSCSL